MRRESTSPICSTGECETEGVVVVGFRGELQRLYRVVQKLWKEQYKRVAGGRLAPAVKVGDGDRSASGLNLAELYPYP